MRFLFLKLIMELDDISVVLGCGCWVCSEVLVSLGIMWVKFRFSRRTDYFLVGFLKSRNYKWYFSKFTVFFIVF